MKTKENVKVDVVVSVKLAVSINLELANMTEEKWLDMAAEEQKRYVEEYLEFDDSPIYDEINDTIFDSDIEYEVESIE